MFVIEHDSSYLFTFCLLCVSEIEAIEACKWLRAAGFPQYAQMYEGKPRFTDQTSLS